MPDVNDHYIDLNASCDDKLRNWPMPNVKNFENSENTDMPGWRKMDETNFPCEMCGRTTEPKEVVKVVTIRDKLHNFKELCECLRLLLLEKETFSYVSKPHLTLLNVIYEGLNEIDEDLKKI